MAESTSAVPQSLESTAAATDPSTDPLLTASSEQPRPTSPRKRRRSPDASVPRPTSAALGKSPSPIQSPRQPTGAAEMAEQKRRKIMKDKDQSQATSKNPQVEALNTLSGSLKHATSNPEDAPNADATALSESLAAIAPELAISEAQQQNNASALTSPVSGGSVATTDSIMAGIAANAPQVASPGSLDHDEEQNATEDGGLQVEQDLSNKALSYPGPLLGVHLDARRGMSLPGSGLPRDNSKSPSTSKKHKCPYCSTEFTRHHNLKSHLLTHSHEKPYLCQTCDSRFRRLHDLKRHTKLHTGERPHVCHKCNRSFARGDALARHNKGQGGCAGRRSSVGSYGGDGMVGGDEMDGMVYTNEASHEPENMDEDDIGGSSVPSIRHHAPVQPPFRAETQPVYGRQSSTYPPVAAQANMGRGLQPPNASHGGSGGGAISQNSQPSLQAFSTGTSYPGVLGPQPMTESPKPLSPGHAQPMSAGDPRNRSPSLSSSMSQQYGRRVQTRNTPPPSLPPPGHTAAPQLPSLAGLAPPDSRFTLHSTPSGSGPSPTLPHPPGGSFTAPGPLHGSGSNSLSSHGTNAHSSGDRGTLPFAGEDRLWAVIHGLEAKVQRLEEDIRILKGQPQSQPAMQPPPTGPPVPPIGR